MKISEYVIAFLTALEKWMWNVVYTEQMGMSSKESGQMVNEFRLPTDLRYGWASRIAHYKGIDHDIDTQ